VDRSLWLLKIGERFGKLPEEVEAADKSLLRHLQIEEWYQQAVAERGGT
jgi:hypothetical protein